MEGTEYLHPRGRGFPPGPRFVIHYNEHACPSVHSRATGYQVCSEFDVQITRYRERFELIIKTEGEDSTSGKGYVTRSRSNHQEEPSDEGDG